MKQTLLIAACIGFNELFAAHAAVESSVGARPNSGSYTTVNSTLGGQGSDSVVAARAALLVLRAAVDSRAENWLFHSNDSSLGAPLSGVEVAARLSALDKPIHCVASSVDSLTAALHCTTPTAEQRDFLMGRVTELESSSGFFAEFAPFMAWRSRVRVSLRGKGESVVLSFAEFEQFIGTYDIGGNSTLGIRLPSPNEGSSTGVIILEAGRIERYDGPIPPL